MAEQATTALMESHSTRFVSMIERQFAAEMGSALAFTDYEKTLAQHLFLKVDAQLKALEAKRTGDVTPYKWENVNMTKLALDAVHRVGLGLDALIPNHVHPIPYFNSKIKKYDVDLRVGYVGKDYCRRKLAVEEPLEVIYELVYDTDVFKPFMRSKQNEIEGYEFEITQPFSRGKTIGGFGYIMYADPKKNRLILVTDRDFKKAEAGAKTKDFWGDEKWRQEMMFKTIVHRVADKLPLDPRKVNAKSYAYVEAQEGEGEEAQFQEEVKQNANSQVIDAEFEVKDEQGSGAETPPAPPPEQAAKAQAPAPGPGPGF